MNTEHTPGPWKLIAAGSDNEDSRLIAQVYKWEVGNFALYNTPSTQESAANANLIASAPELLQALQHLLLVSEYGDETGYVDGEGWLPLEQIQEAARAAIQKALNTSTP